MSGFSKRNKLDKLIESLSAAQQALRNISKVHNNHDSFCIVNEFAIITIFNFILSSAKLLYRANRDNATIASRNNRGRLKRVFQRYRER